MLFCDATGTFSRAENCGCNARELSACHVPRYGTLSFFTSLVIIGASVRPVQAANQVATWDGSTGTWSNATKWSTNPLVPYNGNGDFSYDVNVDAGGVTLDIDATIEHLYVGDPYGSGRVTVSDGRTLTTNAGAELGDSTIIGVVERGFGIVEVTGPGSTWNNTGAIGLGAFGTGNVTILDGGAVTSTSLTAGHASSGVSPTLRGTGNVNVTGQGSSLSLTNFLSIGDSGGFGNLTVDGVANVTAPNVRIGPRGSLRIGFGSMPPGDAPLAANGTATLAGTLSVNFPERPAAGVYRVMDYQQLDGQFSTISVENLAATEYSLSYGGGMNESVSLTVAPKPRTNSSIFWTDSLNNRIVRSNLDGSALQTIVTDLTTPWGIDVDPVSREIYWLTSNQIQRSGLDGSNVENVVGRQGSSGDIAIDYNRAKIYWVNPFGVPGILRANLDGSNTETILSTSGIDGIALDLGAGKIYWTDYLSNTVSRSNLDGSGLETLVSGQANPMNIVLDLDNGRMYWSDNGYEQIRSANLDGSDIQTIANVSGTFTSGNIDIALDGGGSIYWTESTSSGTLARIRRADLDGSNTQTVVQTSNTLISGLAVVLFDTLSGDYNGDGTVNAADYTVYRNAVQSGNLAADGNGDGMITRLDYDVWKMHYGETAGSGALQDSLNSTKDVPEPVTLGQVGLLVIALAFMRRHFRNPD
jgi:T5SS/PEP-CTERM-associated repeat protein